MKKSHSICIPSGKLPVCYWKLSFCSLIYPLKMLTFHRFFVQKMPAAHQFPPEAHEEPSNLRLEVLPEAPTWGKMRIAMAISHNILYYIILYYIILYYVLCIILYYMMYYILYYVLYNIYYILYIIYYILYIIYYILYIIYYILYIIYYIIHNIIYNILYNT